MPTAPSSMPGWRGGPSSDTLPRATCRVPRAATSCAVVVLAGLALVVVGGCSRPEEPPDTVPEVPLGAIDQIYAEMGGDISIEQARADGLHQQELIAECMAERGFEYTPVEPNIFDGQAMAEDWDAMPGTMEFAEKYGYGYASGFWDEQGAANDDVDPAPDPNYARYAAMSTAEAKEYAAALWGEAAMPDAVPDADGAVTGYDWEANGCEGWAQHEMDALPDGLDPDAFTALDAEITAMYGALSTAPEQAELDAAWAQCMAEAGYPDLDVRVDAEDSARGAREAIRERAYATVPPLATDPNVAPRRRAPPARSPTCCRTRSSSRSPTPPAVRKSPTPRPSSRSASTSSRSSTTPTRPSSTRGSRPTARREADARPLPRRRTRRHHRAGARRHGRLHPARRAARRRRAGEQGVWERNPQIVRVSLPDPAAPANGGG